MLRDQQQIHHEAVVKAAVRGQPALLLPLVLQLHEGAVADDLPGIGSDAVNPGIPDLLLHHGKGLPVFQDASGVIIQRGSLHGCLRIFFLKPVKFCLDILRRLGTQVVSRVGEFQNFVHAFHIARRSVLGRILYDHLMIPVFPQEGLRHLRHPGGSVDADVKELDSRPGQLIHNGDGMPRHIRHFRGNGMPAKPLVQPFPDLDAIPEQILIIILLAGIRNSHVKDLIRKNKQQDGGSDTTEHNNPTPASMLSLLPMYWTPPCRLSFQGAHKNKDFPPRFPQSP